MAAAFVTSICDFCVSLAFFGPEMIEHFVENSSLILGSYSFRICVANLS